MAKFNETHTLEDVWPGDVICTPNGETKRVILVSECNGWLDPIANVEFAGGQNEKYAWDTQVEVVS